MKKIFYLASIAALALSSCAKDETTEAQINALNGGSKITAAMSADDTRTSLDANRNVSWSAGDQLGVYTVGGGLSNAAFVLDNASDGQAIGVFASQSAELTAGGKYLAVYPRFQEALFKTVSDNKEYTHPTDATKDNIKMADYQNVTVKIPAVQKYQNGSFYTQTVPAVSTAFTVDTDGEAKVSMQPVVDYLFVNIQSVEPIYELQLQLFDGTKSGDSNRYKLNGTTNLQSYVYNGEYRHYANFGEATSSKTAPEATITLEIDEASAKVMCHSANTYVFTVPANILGKGIAANTRAVLTINPGKDNEKKIAFTNDSNNIGKTNGDVTYVKNNTLNYTVKDGKQDNSDANRNFRQLNTATDYANDQLLPLENTIFWMNDLDANGDRTAFTYNPANTFIIENEGDLLMYLTNYNASTNAVDALICNDHTFDFSVTNIQNLSTRLQKEDPEAYTKYEPYYSAYLKGSFPTINGEYKNTFRGMEYNGQVPVITGIEKALASENGIFGNNITGTIKDVKFSGIEAAKTDRYAPYGYYYYGNILGSIATGGKLDNVTVENAHGSAILGAGNVAAYNELTVADVDKLNFIINDMDIEKDLEIANWSVVSGVATSVFGTLDATTNGKTADDEYDSHHVVTLPAGADYAELALYTGVANKTATISSSEFTAAEIIPDYVAGTLPNLVHIDVDQTNLNVVSVMIDGKSYWTGDKFPFAADFWSKSKLLPATYTKSSDKIGETAVKGWYKVQYAEHLATGADGSVALQNDIVLSTSTMPWTMVEVTGTIEGQGKTISGVAMNEKIESPVAGIAPVKAAKINNVIVDGVSIDVFTLVGDSDSYVPNIGGLALDTRFVSNVTLKNLEINAYGIDATQASQALSEAAYPVKAPVYVGWLVATATDPDIESSKVEGVKSNVYAVSGLVGKATLSAGAYVRHSTASNVQSAQAALTEFKEVGSVNAVKASFGGTAVGAVFNDNDSASETFTFEGVGTPVFLYYAPSTIVVSYIGNGTKNLNNATGKKAYNYTSGYNGGNWLGQ